MTKQIGDIPEWFRGSRLNFAENLLRYDGTKVALIQCGACMCGWVGYEYGCVNMMCRGDEHY